MTTGSSVSCSEHHANRQRRHCTEHRRISHRIPLKPITLSAGGRLPIAFSPESLIGSSPGMVIGFPPES